MRKDSEPSQSEPSPQSYQSDSDLEGDDCFGPVRAVQCTGPSCAYCHKILQKPLNCGRCKMLHYCSSDCQKKDWLAGHAQKCPQIVKLKGFTENRKSIGKGQGLFATKDIPANTAVAIFVLVPMAGIPNVELLKYHVGGYNGYFKNQEPAQGGSINDPNKVISSLLSIQTAKDCEEFVQSYQDPSSNNVTLSCMDDGKYSTVFATKHINAGDELAIAYGYEYWLNLLVAKGIPGASFQNIWVTLHFLMKLEFQATAPSLLRMLDIDLFPTIIDGEIRPISLLKEDSSKIETILDSPELYILTMLRGIVILIGHLLDTIDDVEYAKKVVSERFKDISLDPVFNPELFKQIETWTSTIIDEKNPGKVLDLIDTLLPKYQLSKD
jgi:hypothetical protein